MIPSKPNNNIEKLAPSLELLSFDSKRLELQSMIEESDGHIKCWQLFSKAKNALQSGARLENLSWRMFNTSIRGQGSRIDPRILIAQSSMPPLAIADIPPPIVRQTIPSLVKREDTNQKVCLNCSTAETGLWRRDPSGNVLCNACGLFFKLHSEHRPLRLKSDVIRKRNRKPVAKAKITITTQMAVSSPDPLPMESLESPEESKPRYITRGKRARPATDQGQPYSASDTPFMYTQTMDYQPWDQSSLIYSAPTETQSLLTYSLPFLTPMPIQESNTYAIEKQPIAQPSSTSLFTDAFLLNSPDKDESDYFKF